MVLSAPDEIDTLLRAAAQETCRIPNEVSLCIFYQSPQLFIGTDGLFHYSCESDENGSDRLCHEAVRHLTGAARNSIRRQVASFRDQHALLPTRRGCLHEWQGRRMQAKMM